MHVDIINGGGCAVKLLLVYYLMLNVNSLPLVVPLPHVHDPPDMHAFTQGIFVI